MSRTQSIESLKVSLTKALDEWIENNCESKEWESLDCLVGNETSRLMASAAMSVLEAVSESQEYANANT